MEQAKTIARKTILGILLALMLIITGWTLLTLSQNAIVIRNDFPARRLLILTLTAGLMAAIYAKSFSFRNLSESKLDAFIRRAWFLMLLLQIFFLFAFAPNQITDSYMVNDQALAIAEGTEDTFDPYSWYFNIYKNNNLLTILLTVLYRGMIRLNVLRWSGKILGGINILCVDLSILFLCRTAELLRGRQSYATVLLLSVLNPFSYVLNHWIYTLIVSLPLMTGAVYLAFFPKRRRLCWIGIGIISVFSYYIRATALIPVIAVAGYACLKSGKNHFNWKKDIVTFVLTVVISALLFFIIAKIISLYAINTSRYLPMLHWYLMGMHGIGEAYGEDILHIGGYTATEYMREEIINGIRYTRSQYTPYTFSIHQLKKLAHTWTDGSAEYNIKLYLDRNLTPLYQWICGEKSDFALAYCQAYRGTVYCFSCVSIIRQLFSKKSDDAWFASLTVFGAICFFMLWEAKSAYSVPFVPFFIYLATDGCNWLGDRRGVKKTVQFGAPCVIAAFIVLSVLGIKTFVDKSYHWHDYAINTESFNFPLYDDTVSGQIRQEFVCRKPFDEVLIQCVSDQKSTCEVKLHCGQELLAEDVIDSDSIEDGFFHLKVPDQLPKTPTEYVLDLVPENDSGDFQICYLLSKASSQYDGVCTVNGKGHPDINIRVIRNSDGPYMTLLCYLLLVSAVAATGIWTYCRLSRITSREGKQ